jgi:DNA repair exonuclease SbcCD ATPase subunit
MLKKLLLVAVVAGFAFAGLRHTRVFGYAKSEAHSLREWADDQIPIEDKIKQMRRDVAGLDRDAERVRDELAKEIVEVRDQTSRVGSYRAQLETERKNLLARGDELKGATEKVSVGRLVVPVGEAKDMLRQDVNRHEKRKKQLDDMEKSLAHHERIRDTLAKQLDGMVRQKQLLTTEIDAVEAEYKSVQLAQIESKYQNDDSRLSQVKESLTSMRKKLDVEREKLNLAPKVYEEAGPVASTQSVEDILAPLNGTKPAKADAIEKTE